MSWDIYWTLAGQVLFGAVILWIVAKLVIALILTTRRDLILQDKALEDDDDADSKLIFKGEK